MANISAEGAAQIREHVTDWSPADATIAGSLNAPAIANPAPQPTVAKAFLTHDLMSLLDAPALAKIQSLPSLARLLDDIELGVSSRLDNWLALLTVGGTITTNQAAALSGVIHATELDPAWPSQISWAVANLGRPVDLEDIAASRPGDNQ